MFNKKLPSLWVGLLVLSSSLAFGSNCIAIKGAIHTTVMDPTDPSLPTLGTLSLLSKVDKKICGIQGQIIDSSDFGLPILSHQIACGDHSIFSSKDKVVVYIPMESNPNRIYIEEKSVLTPGPGDYEDYIGTTLTKGYIDMETGKNNFIYSGKLCSK
jgi:hypothetical protein